MTKNQSALLLAIIVLATTCVGCCSIVKKYEPGYTLSQITPSADKPSLSYSFAMQTISKDEKTKIAEQPAQVKKGQSIVESVLKESDVFSSVSTTPGSGDYLCDMTLSKTPGKMGPYGEKATPYVFFLDIYMLFLLPVSMEEGCTLTADIKTGDKVIKQYKYNHSRKNWIEFFLIFATPFASPNKAEKQMMNDMLNNMLFDMQKDGFLAKPLPKNG